MCVSVLMCVIDLKHGVYLRVCRVCLFVFVFFFQRRLQRCCLVLLRISCPVLSLLPFSLANQGFLSLLCLFSFLFLFPTNNGSAPTLGEEIRLFFILFFSFVQGGGKEFFFGILAVPSSSPCCCFFERALFSCC